LTYEIPARLKQQRGNTAKNRQARQIGGFAFAPASTATCDESTLLGPGTFAAMIFVGLLRLKMIIQRGVRKRTIRQ